MHFIKQLKLNVFMQCKCFYRTGALPCKLRAVGSIPKSGTGSFFFFLSFPPLFPYTDYAFNYPGVYVRLWQGPVRLSGGCKVMRTDYSTN